LDSRFGLLSGTGLNADGKNKMNALNELSDIAFLFIFISVPGLFAMIIGFFLMWRERH
jgi:F0F1-type ATP synthase membrane subunit c/vacuolar-type H+-ATPase subunit K